MLLPIQIAANRLLQEVPQAPFERMIASCGFVMSAEAAGINNLLSHSQNLGRSKRKNGDK